MINKPIPVTKPLCWEAILALPITPKSEPLVDTSCLLDQQIYTQSDYFKQGIAHALPTCYVREGLLARLRRAASFLPDGVHLLILDAGHRRCHRFGLDLHHQFILF